MQNRLFEEQLKTTFVNTGIIGVVPLLFVITIATNLAIFARGEDTLEILWNSSSILLMFIGSFYAIFLILNNYRSYKYVINNYIDDEREVKLYLRKKLETTSKRIYFMASQKKSLEKNINLLLGLLDDSVPDTKLFDVDDVYENIENNKDYLNHI